MADLDYQSIYHGTEMDDLWGKAGTAVQGVKVNGTELTKDSAKKVNIVLNKAAVGLGNVNNTSDASKPVSTAQAAALALKVDKVAGKSLSTNDYTDGEKAKVGHLPEDIAEEYAKKDGYYEQMGVGYAANLMGNGAATQEMIDFRPSGGTKDIGSGVEIIKTIQGNTVVWNQLINIVAKTITNNGITYTLYADGKIHIEGTAQGNSDALIVTYPTGNTHYFFISANIVSDNARVAFTFIPNGQKANIRNLFSYSDFHIMVADGVSVNQDVFYSLIDLTQMFGAGNEPSTVDDPRIKWLESLGYIPYTAEPFLLNYKGTGLKTTGVNQWDEEWEEGKLWGNNGKVISGGQHCSKNLIKCTPNTQYYRLEEVETYTQIVFYDDALNKIGSKELVSNTTFQTPVNAAYIGLNFYGASQSTVGKVQIALYHSGGDIPTTYHPHEEHILSLSITTVTGKLNGAGESVTIFPDGAKSAGTAKDLLYGDALGVIRKVRKVIAKVKLKDLSWTGPDADGRFTSEILSSIRDGSRIVGVLTSAYVAFTHGEAYDSTWDKVIYSVSRRILIHDSAYTDAASFKAHFTDDDYLYYELATPEEYILDTPINTTAYVNDWGTEENQPQGKDEQGFPLTTPLNAEIVYAPNVQDAIRNLPKNYISKETMDTILVALKTAGVIGGYTLTWDATNEKYNCTITP